MELTVYMSHRVFEFRFLFIFLLQKRTWIKLLVAVFVLHNLWRLNVYILLRSCTHQMYVGTNIVCKNPFKHATFFHWTYIHYIVFKKTLLQNTEYTFKCTLLQPFLNISKPPFCTIQKSTHKINESFIFVFL